MSNEFWKNFWEGANPAYWLAWMLYGMGHVVSRFLRWDACEWLYPAYNTLMLASLRVQRRFGLSGPWSGANE